MPGTQPTGLSQPEAAARRAAEGPNELGADQSRSLPAIAAEVVREPMFLLLLVAGTVYLSLGNAREALVLLGFVAIIMGVTIAQERRTETALAALRQLSSPRALVVRDGVPQRIAGRDVVRGDLLVLAEGDRVPADALVLEAHELATDESLRTGEAEAAPKFADGAAMVFAGTLVVRGQGLARVVAVGAHTELGRIGQSLAQIAPESSPLQREIGRLTRRLALIGLALCGGLMLLYVWLRGGWVEGLLAGVTLAMGILPQEFPVILIVFLAFGARRIAAQRVLTRRLHAIETLGETTVLCVDKTGTLTQNRMRVAELLVQGQRIDAEQLPPDGLPELYHELLEYLVLASELAPQDPMEKAFHRFAGDTLADTEHLHPDWQLAREYELSPALMAMSHLWRDGSGQLDVVATKGAPEAIADLCHLAPEAHAAWMQDAQALAARGLRVLGVAKARHPVASRWPAQQHDFNFVPVGLVGLVDPLRPEAAAAVAECRRAGIRVVMITGDHPQTAAAIAVSAGLDAGQVLTGAELAAMDAKAFDARVAATQVFARVTPQQKLAIVESLKRSGAVVAMTGDGVNDAPALKAAHIGIAMGRRGTDVAREAASLVLLDDDFGAIVAAVRLGRRIYANLRQALVYTLAVHVPIIGLSLLPVLFGLPLLLAPVHIAFLELVIDPACSVVFEAEEGEDGLMAQPPRASGERLIALGQLGLSLGLGALVTLGVLLLYGMNLHAGVAVEAARAQAFTALVLANTALIFALRKRVFAWRQLFTRLPGVSLWVVGATLLALALITRVPALAALFDFVAPVR